MTVGLAVVHAVSGQMRLGVGDRANRERIERNQGKAALESPDQLSVTVLHDPAERFGHIPALDRAAGKRKPVERRRENIDPIDRIVARAPQRTFAETVANAAVDRPPVGHSFLASRRRQ